MAIERLYEDDDYVIVNKPYDMYINSDDENERVSLNINYLKNFRIILEIQKFVLFFEVMFFL